MLFILCIMNLLFSLIFGRIPIRAKNNCHYFEKDCYRSLDLSKEDSRSLNNIVDVHPHLGAACLQCVENQVVADVTGTCNLGHDVEGQNLNVRTLNVIHFCENKYALGL